jgi:hypothetical protein
LRGAIKPLLGAPALIPPQALIDKLQMQLRQTQSPDLAFQ